MSETVDDAVRARAVALGEAGEAWLEALPERLAELCARWSLTLGPPLAGATGAFVVRVTGPRVGGVLKLGLPEPVSRNQIRLLVAAAGHGYAAVLAHDEALGAVLLEELGPSLAEADIPPEAQLECLAELLLEAWALPPLPWMDATRAAGKADGLAALVRTEWEALGRPCGEAAVERALGCAERRAAAYDVDRLVVAHGDPHPGNALRRPGGGFAFVDPDGELGERSYDLGVTLRDWSFQLAGAPDPAALLDSYATLLAERTGEDATAIAEWGYLERVSTGLYALSRGLDDFARRLLASADALAA
jgi:streptomycin 6-kinase